MTQTFSKNQTPPSYGYGRYGFGLFGPKIAFRATGALWGCATPFLHHFSVHLSSVLGRTELCHEVWTPGPPKPQIISNENHNLALLEKTLSRRNFALLSGPQQCSRQRRRKVPSRLEIPGPEILLGSKPYHWGQNDYLPNLYS